MTALDRQEQEALAKLQATYEGLLSSSWLDAVEEVKGAIDWAEVQRLLAADRPNAALDLIQSAIEAHSQPAVLAAIQAAVLAGGGFAASSADTQVRALTSDPLTVTQYQVSFNVGSLSAQQAMAGIDPSKIQSLNRQTLEGIRQALSAGLAAGLNPIDIARDLREGLGLTPNQEAAVRNYRAALEAGSAKASRYQLRDKRFKGGKDLPKAKIDKMVTRYKERYLKYRSQTIARTETARAISMGQDALWRQAIADGKYKADQIGKRWVYTSDGRARHAHVTIPTRNKDNPPLIGEPFQSELGPIQYPGDAAAAAGNVCNCRCAVVYRVLYL